MLLGHVARRLADFRLLAPDDCDAVHQLQGAETIHHPRGDDVSPSQDAQPRIIVAGWAGHIRPQALGRRQIFGFLVPGDVIGSFWRQPEYSFHRTVALTRLQSVSAQTLIARTADGSFRHPTVVDAARRAEDHAQHLLLNHIMRLGARDAYAGLAHLLLELHERLECVGLASQGTFRLPLGQRVLAQAMGLSLAHTNHTLQRMAADGLLEADDDVMRLLQPERMATLADFRIEAAYAPPRERATAN